MFDLHLVPAGWGLYPRLFGLSSYGVFVLLGLALGAGYYFWSVRGLRADGEKAAVIVLAALLGAAVGAKLPTLIFNSEVFAANPQAIFSGKTVLGGLLGGFLAVLAVKRICKIRGRYGNLIAPAAAIGLTVGRVGCLLTGCCFGRTASWGLNFGDGVLRYPTQAFEIAFHFGAFCVLHLLQKRVKTPGILFKGYVLAYLIFRWATEYLRESEVLWAGQTLYQWLCIGGILLVGPKLIQTIRKKEARQNV